MALTHAIGEMLGQMGYEVTRLVIRILGNPEWLSVAYLDATVIPHQVNFGWFLQGFNSVESLVEFVAMSDVPTPVYRMRGEWSTILHTIGNANEKLQTRWAY